MKNKNFVFKKLLTCLVLTMAAMFTVSVARSASIEEIRENIQKTTLLLKQEKSSHQREKGNSLRVEESLKDRISSLEQKISEAEQEIDRLKGEINSTKSRNSDLIVKKKKINLFLSRTKSFLYDTAENLQSDINAGFPYLTEERAGRMDSFRKKLRNEEQCLLESCRELYSYFVREIDLGYNSEIYSDEIKTKDGKFKNVRSLRIGRIFLAYMTKDEEESALLVKGENGFEWNTDLNLWERGRIRKAVEIMEGKRIPRLVEFPVGPVLIMPNQSTTDE